MIQSLTIDGISEDLFGYGFIDGKKFTFPYVKPGDEVQFLSLGKGKRRYYKNLTVPNYEPEISGCRYFTYCGGCRGRHIPYIEQFHYKTQPILEKFREAFGVELRPVIPDRSEAYRNRMDFAVFPGAIGLRQEGNFRRIVDIEKCSIQSEKANLELEILRKILEPLAYNRKTGSGFLKYITLRIGMKEELMTILTFTKDFRESSELERLKNALSSVSIAENLIFCFTRNQAEVSATGDFINIRGREYLLQEVGGRILRVPFDSFFQPNPEGFSPILDFISNELSGCEGNRMIDLFCGSGFFSLIFGDRFEEIFGIDIVESSILQAKKNAELLFPDKKMVFKVVDLFSQKGNLREDWMLETKSVVFVDPPRNGLGLQMIRFLLENNFDKIFYISCNPHSQFRDLQSLYEKYKIGRGLLTDPYPHTPHLESVICLERRHESSFK